MRLAAVFATLVSFLLPTACESRKEDSAPAPEPRPQALRETPPTLRGPQWVLSPAGELSFPTSGRPVIQFGAKRVGGGDGCNLFSAPLHVDGPEMEIEALRIITTLMACEVGDEEFIAALGKVEEWKLDGGRLVLSGAGPDLRFERASPVGSWRAISIRETSGESASVYGSEITARFAPDGSLSGSAGCNEYSGRYEIAGSRVATRGLFVTEMECALPPGRMKSEPAYLDALTEATAFRLEPRGPTLALTLMNSKGASLATFERSR